jgi:hypothetical protein
MNRGRRALGGEVRRPVRGCVWMRTADGDVTVTVTASVDGPDAAYANMSRTDLRALIQRLADALATRGTEDTRIASVVEVRKLLSLGRWRALARGAARHRAAPR